MSETFDFRLAYQPIWSELSEHRLLTVLADERDPFHALVLKIALGHLEQQKLWEECLGLISEARDGFALVIEHTRLCIDLEDAILLEEDPPAIPAGSVKAASFGDFGWLDVGLSALLLELLLRHIGGALPSTSERRRTALMAEGFAIERRHALRMAAKESRDEDVRQDARSFIVPAVKIWGDALLREAYTILKDRLPKREVLRSTVTALREAVLADDPWLYLEPQLDRHAALFDLKLTGILGRPKKFAIKKLVQHFASAQSGSASGGKGTSDDE